MRLMALLAPRPSVFVGELYGFRNETDAVEKRDARSKSSNRGNQADSERLQLGNAELRRLVNDEAERAIHPICAQKSSLSKCGETCHTENRLGQPTVTGCKSAWSSCTFCATWAFASWRRFVQDNCVTECIHMMLVCLMSSSLCVSNQASTKSSLSVFQKTLLHMTKTLGCHEGSEQCVFDVFSADLRCC